MTRHIRRASERLARNNRRHATDAASKNARVAEAQQNMSRLQAMLSATMQALQLANQIPDVPKPDGWTAEDGDPNFFKTSAIVDFEMRLAASREQLIVATEEFYLALEALDPDATPTLVAVPSIVTP